MVRPDFFKNVGKFDENFAPAYLEDVDMRVRLKLGNFKSYSYGGAKVDHIGSSTLKHDQSVRNAIDIAYAKNLEYFKCKWGNEITNNMGLMKKMYYKYPFNDKNNKLSYWSRGK
jgi:GT2 family glycosyltransferase